LFHIITDNVICYCYIFFFLSIIVCFLIGWIPSSGKVQTTTTLKSSLNPDDGRNASYYMCAMIFWATRQDGVEFYNAACHTYNDLMSSYSHKIQCSMNILVRRILLSQFYKNVRVFGVPHSFQEIHYPTFDFSDLYLSEHPDFSNIHLYDTIETCGLGFARLCRGLLI